jgi:hypothetical protein
MNKSKFSFNTLFLLLFLLIVGCTNSPTNQKFSPEISTSVPVTNGTGSKGGFRNPTSSTNHGSNVPLPGSTNQMGNDPLWGISASQPPKSGGGFTPTSVVSRNEQSEQQRGPSTTALFSNSPPTTALPRFLSFACTVTTRDIDNRAPTGSEALEIQVRTSGPTTGGVWLETTSQDFRRRSAIKLDAEGDGRTVHFVPVGATTEVNVFASYTYEPSSLMCRTSN